MQRALEIISAEITLFASEKLVSFYYFFHFFLLFASEKLASFGGIECGALQRFCAVDE